MLSEFVDYTEFYEVSKVAGIFSGRAEVPGYASIPVMLFPLIYCSVTCNTQAQ